MPRIHYPKGIRTSRGSEGRSLGGGRRIPRRGSPFFTKAHETLTRRPGESGCLRFLNLQHVRRSHRIFQRLHAETISRRSGDFPSLVTGQQDSDEAEPKRPVGGDLPEEAFQRGTLAGSFSSRLGTRQSCSETRFERSYGRHPDTYRCRFTGSRPGSQPVLYARRDHGDSSTSGPLPDYEPGLV